MGKLATFFALMFIVCSLLCIVVEGGGFAVTRLNGAVSDTDSTITVSSTEGFIGADVGHLGYAVIDEEIFSYSNKTSTTFTGCTRGATDPQTLVQTDAATHVDGAKVRTTSVTAVDSFIGYNISSSTATFGTLEALKFTGGMAGGFFRNLPRMLAWDYPFFDGMLVYVRYLLFALSAGFVFAIAMAMLTLASRIWV